MRKILRCARAFLNGIPFILLAVGCTVEQKLSLSPDLSGEWSISGEAMPFAAEAFDDLATLGGFDNASALYDEAIVNSRTDIGGREDIRSYSIERTAAHAWKAKIQFKNLMTILGSSDTVGIAEILHKGNSSTLNLRFNRERALKLEEIIPIMNDPTFSLFNPASTVGIDEETYITGILGFTFGEGNIPAIRKASIGMTVVLPGPVTAVSGGTKTGTNSARFQTPLSRFLVPEKEIFWSVTWNTGS